MAPLAVGRRKVAPDVNSDLPPPPMTHAGANSSSRKKAQVLLEKNTPANAPRKRKERIKTLLDPSAKDENEHEPPRKKTRRADPSTRRYAVLFLFLINSSLFQPLGFYFFLFLVFNLASFYLFFNFLVWHMLFSRGAKENKETSRTARETAKIVMDKVRLLSGIVGRRAIDEKLIRFYCPSASAFPREATCSASQTDVEGEEAGFPARWCHASASLAWLAARRPSTHESQRADTSGAKRY